MSSYCFSVSIVLFARHLVDGLALITPPPAAKPVVVGTSAYSNILFGKLQRAAALWGTNLGQPTTVITRNDKEQNLKKCLWSQFYMASPGTEGILKETDLVKPLSPWIPHADLKDPLVFFDTTSAPDASRLSFLPFGGKEEGSSAPTINSDVLQCAAARGCAHVYVLANYESLEGCYATLEQYAGIVPSTIVALEGNIVMEPTPGWKTSRPQNMQGEFLRPVSLRPYNPEDFFSNSNAILPAEDVAEVMMQVALRTDRNFLEYPRVIQVAPGGDTIVERSNADYVTVTTNEQGGSVLAVASWEKFLWPLGDVNTELGKRPDQVED